MNVPLGHIPQLLLACPRLVAQPVTHSHRPGKLVASAAAGHSRMKYKLTYVRISGTVEVRAGVVTV